MSDPIVNEIKIDNEADSIIALENLIKNHIRSIDEFKAEYRVKREMLNDGFYNDPVYREHSEKVKQASKARLSVKYQIAKQPSVAILDQAVKDLRLDIKEANANLSELLLEYKSKTQATQLELFGGQIVEIVEIAKIRKLIGK